jgi:repressor LexA
MKGPTKRQSEILALIQSISKARGYPPSYRELMKLLGLSSPGTLHKHMKNLRAKGLNQPPQLPQKPSSTVPIIGQIAKGQKMELFAKVSLFELPPSWITKQSLYGFVVKDHSFMSLAIQPGDLLVVDSSKEPKPGELVLAKSGPHSQIEVFNSEHFEAEELEIQGVISALFRHFH